MQLDSAQIAEFERLGIRLEDAVVLGAPADWHDFRALAEQPEQLAGLWYNNMPEPYQRVLPFDQAVESIRSYLRGWDDLGPIAGELPEGSRLLDQLARPWGATFEAYAKMTARHAALARRAASDRADTLQRQNARVELLSNFANEALREVRDRIGVILDDHDRPAGWEGPGDTLAEHAAWREQVIDAVADRIGLLRNPEAATAELDRMRELHAEVATELAEVREIQRNLKAHPGVWRMYNLPEQVARTATIGATRLANLLRGLPADADGSAPQPPDPGDTNWSIGTNADYIAAEPTRAVGCVPSNAADAGTWLYGKTDIAEAPPLDGFVDGDLTKPVGGLPIATL
jgi:hypothetical protein